MNENPFIEQSSIERYGRLCGPACVQDRLDALPRYDVERLERIVAWEGTQKTVRRAAVRILKIKKQGPKPEGIK